MCTERKPHPHAELIKAWADGAVIQFWSLIEDRWVDTTNNRPHWDGATKYRIKPKTTKAAVFVRFYWDKEAKMVRADYDTDVEATLRRDKEAEGWRWFGGWLSAWERREFVVGEV